MGSPETVLVESGIVEASLFGGVVVFTCDLNNRELPSIQLMRSDEIVFQFDLGKESQASRSSSFSCSPGAHYKMCVKVIRRPLSIS